MNHGLDDEWAALYALDLLEGRERRAFVNAMQRDDRLHDVADELRETAALLACCDDNSSPSPDLKHRLQSRIATPPAASNVPPSHQRIFPLLGWAAAAGFAPVALWLGQMQFSTRAENSLLRQTQSLGDTTVRSAQYRLEAESILHQHERDEAHRQITQLEEQLATQQSLTDIRISILKSGQAHDRATMAVVVWHPMLQEGLLTVDTLPVLPLDKDYQLWALDDRQPAPIDCGVFQVAADSGQAEYHFHPTRPVAPAAKFAVSLERKGGVAQAAGPMVLLGD